jgi:glutathione S-transferase
MYPGEYTLIGNEMSLFTRKLEAQLRFQRIPWQYQYKTQARAAELEARAGTHFIPLLTTPDKWLIHDTIAIGPLLNDRFCQRPVIPSTPLQRACCFILEDAFNHWLGKSAIHSRWCYPENVAWVGPRFAANLMLDRSMELPFSEEELEQFAGVGPMMYEGFGRNVCEVNGVGPDQAASMQADFAAMLDALAAHFAGNDFLLGPRPCLADFALAGASKAHFITDPTPRSWLGKHEAMLLHYTGGFFSDAQDNDSPWLSKDSVPAELPIVLDYLQGSYFRFATANIAAGLAGEKYFEYDYGYEPTRARTQRRLNLARLHVQDELQRLGAEANPDIQALFSGRGILEYYLGQPGD